METTDWYLVETAVGGPALYIEAHVFIDARTAARTLLSNVPEGQIHISKSTEPGPRAFAAGRVFRAVWEGNASAEPRSFTIHQASADQVDEPARKKRRVLDNKRYKKKKKNER